MLELGRRRMKIRSWDILPFLQRVAVRSATEKKSRTCSFWGFGKSVCPSRKPGLKTNQNKYGECSSHCPVRDKGPGFHEAPGRTCFCCLPCPPRFERWKLECSVTTILCECSGSQGCSKIFARPGTFLCLWPVAGTAIRHLSMGR